MFKSTIQGIPCQISVTLYHPEESAHLSGNPDHWEEGCAEEFEYEVYDRKGYKANWLSMKITEKDEQQIYSNFLNWRELV